MPSVLPPFKGLRTVIFSDDHRPPHVHEMGAEEHARFELLCDVEQVRLLSNVGFTQRQLRQIEGRLLNHLVHLCNEWGRIHGRQ